jgi:hypothetical protein
MFVVRGSLLILLPMSVRIVTPSVVFALVRLLTTVLLVQVIMFLIILPVLILVLLGMRFMLNIVFVS